MIVSNGFMSSTNIIQRNYSQMNDVHGWVREVCKKQNSTMRSAATVSAAAARANTQVL